MSSGRWDGRARAVGPVPDPGPGALYASARMGQSITVTSRPGSRAGVRFFELNRSITGMDIERYGVRPPDSAQRPPDVVAKRLFDLGATSVTVYSSMVSVEAPAAEWERLDRAICHTLEHLFNYYGDDAGWSFPARGLPYTPSPVQ